MSGRILYCASTASHIVNFHLPYLKHFKGQGWQVDVAVGGTARPIPYADQVIELPLEKSLAAVGNLQAVRSVQRLLVENRYDLISTHTALAGAVVRLAVKRAGKQYRGKVVHTSHGYFFNGRGSLAEMAYLEAEKYLSSVTDMLMVMNEVDHQLAIQYQLGKRIVCIPGMGIDLNKFSVANPGEKEMLKRDAGYHVTDFLIVYAAEMSKRKNQRELLRTFAMASSQEPSMRLILAGDGALMAEYQELARKLRIGGKVCFPGYVRDMASIYKMCDLAVTTSKCEGLPFNVMEAMACSLPVVASKIKGHMDLLGERSEYLYSLGDEQALTHLMRAFFQDSSLGENAGDNNRQKVLVYQLERVEPVIEGVYERVFRGGSRKHE
ncbi:glycosyltransferase EpsD [Desulfitobacterium sp. LBE]|uniref:glycosyltransferase n=1 Tax=Desulfitobacterium sp. LBE TaxID=884086 RepID=UPI00119901F7|nr:glycosyltransferase [Desulfitobacterium sp. LBE]TWH59718.1 glycosyltransferase EpsD [Desulfitobacterium sp. LBE]